MNRSLQFIVMVFIAGTLAACASSTQPEPLRRGGETFATIDADCHPVPDSNETQYIVGYGSLMQDESRKRTSPQAGPAHPVEVAGYRRGWFARAESVGFSTTYLGVTPDPKGRANAIICNVQTSELLATDRREASYCRKSVVLSAIKTLEKGTFRLVAGQAWIYVNRPEGIAVPSARYPIVHCWRNNCRNIFHTSGSNDLSGSYGPEAVSHGSRRTTEWLASKALQRRFRTTR
jgi:hypothetical protein